MSLSSLSRFQVSSLSTFQTLARAYSLKFSNLSFSDSKSSDKTSTSDSSKNDESKADQNSKDSFTSSVSSNPSSSLKNYKNDSSGNEVSTSLGSSSAIIVDSSDSSGMHTIRKVKFLSKNSILTKTQHFHEFFTQIFFDNFSREIKVVNS